MTADAMVLATKNSHAALLLLRCSSPEQQPTVNNNACSIRCPLGRELNEQCGWRDTHRQNLLGC
jgi:hypothetical protein